MSQLKSASLPDEGEERLFRLAELLDLQFSADELAALSRQLRLLDALERDELQAFPPILIMDAGWHD